MHISERGVICLLLLCTHHPFGLPFAHADLSLFINFRRWQPVKGLFFFLWVGRGRLFPTTNFLGNFRRWYFPNFLKQPRPEFSSPLVFFFSLSVDR